MTLAGFEITRSSFFSTHYASPSDALGARMRLRTEPTFPLLVGRARRFTSLVTQLHIEVCGAVTSRSEPGLPTVFATCHGEIQTADALIADLYASKVVSSARFALSVHNTASGQYAVATGNTEPSTTITGANAVAAGWLEAVLIALESGKPTLLSVADEPVPKVFRGPAVVEGVAAAFVVAPLSGRGRRAEIAMTPSPRGGEAAPETVRTLAQVADSTMHGRAEVIRLGPIRPGSSLELHVGAMP